MAGHCAQPRVTSSRAMFPGDWMIVFDPLGVPALSRCPADQISTSGIQSKANLSAGQRQRVRRRRSVCRRAVWHRLRRRHPVGEALCRQGRQARSKPYVASRLCLRQPLVVCCVNAAALHALSRRADHAYQNLHARSCPLPCELPDLPAIMLEMTCRSFCCTAA